jgi:hypothetical protein
MVDPDFFKCLEEYDSLPYPRLADFRMRGGEVTLVIAALKAAMARREHTQQLIANQNGILQEMQLPEEREFARLYRR